MMDIDHQADPMHRREYHQKLNDSLRGTGITYDGKKSKLVSDVLFEYFEAIDSQAGKPRVELAIERSDRNEKRHLCKSPAQSESCTYMHHLVKMLLHYR